MARTDFDVMIDAAENLRQWKIRLLAHQVKYGDTYSISETIKEIEKTMEILES